jgi:hypothetical protein
VVVATLQVTVANRVAVHLAPVRREAYLQAMVGASTVERVQDQQDRAFAVVQQTVLLRVAVQL